MAGLSDLLLNEHCLKISGIVPGVRYKESVCCNFMFNSGIRAMECVDLHRWARLSNGIVKLKPQKFNYDRYFNDVDLPGYLLNWVDNGINDIDGLTYRQISYSLSTVIGNTALYVGKKKVNCHVFRHNYVRQKIELGMSYQDVQNLMGLKSIEPIITYATAPIYFYGNS